MLCVAFVAGSAIPSQAQRADLGSHCVGNSDGKIICDIWISEAADIQRVTVRQAAGGAEREATFTPYAADEKTGAWLILVDKSNPARQATVDKVKEALNTIIDGAGDKHSVGLASFADKLEIVAPIGSSKVKLKLAVDRLKAEGVATELFRIAEEGIDALRSVQADRKALVIFSDGKAEDTNAFPIERVVRKARDAGVVIYGVGYLERAADAPSLQSLRRLARDTGGPFVSAILPDKTLPEDFTSDFYRFLGTGGRIVFDAPTTGTPGSNLAYTITAQTSSTSNPRISGTAEVAFVAGPMEDPIGWLQRQYEENQIIVIAAGAAALLLLLALILLIVRGVRRRKDQPVPAPGAAINDEPAKKRLVLAWLEMVDNGERIAIDETTVRIGRHSDNDIRLEEDAEQSTVHRRHATIHVTPDREFIITDLSGEDGNGVFVNSERIARRALNDGDLIELGLVKLRFQVADI